MDGSLNIAYLFYTLYTYVTGIPISVGSIPDIFMQVMIVVAIVGLVSSVLLLTMIVYFRIRTLEVEHHGFHELEKKAHIEHAHAVEHVAKNPRWETVAVLASSPNESDWRRAILEADILLGSLLTERGYAGDTLGEQLKSANRGQFTTLDLAWEAHRMRNALAHLGEAFPLTDRDIRTTIDQYRQVFEEFDYI